MKQWPETRRIMMKDLQMKCDNDVEVYSMNCVEEWCV